MSTPLFQAALRTNTDDALILGTVDWWDLTNDAAAIANANTEDIIWVGDTESLKLELEARYPAPHAKLTMLFEGYNRFVTLKHPRYLGTDTAEVYQLSKEFGQITVGDYYSYVWMEKLLANPDIKRDCRVWRHKDGDLHMIYEPRSIQRKAAADAKRLAKLGVSIADVVKVTHETTKKINHYDAVKSSGMSCGLDEACSTMVLRLAVFNTLFGKHAHRKWEPFQTLCKIWKDRSENNDDTWKVTETTRNFVVWMNNEAKKRTLKPLVQVDGASDPWVAIDIHLLI